MVSNKEKNKIYIASIKRMLKNNNLCIPLYQRPYEWEKKDILNLLLDIEYGIKQFKKNKIKYRLGTIILYDDIKNEKLEIVDGQQRLISLCLILHVLELDNDINLLKNKIQNSSITYDNIKNNYDFLKQWFNRKEKNILTDFKQYIFKSIEFFVIEVKNQDYAFQLFNSNNSKGKTLEPTDLLKAYHLQNMNTKDAKVKNIIIRWENYENTYFDDMLYFDETRKKTYYFYDDNKIVPLFKYYLFPIYNWSINQKIINYFSKDDINLYKGIENNSYNYSKIYTKYYNNSKYKVIFNINKPFLKGEYFFKMVEYYIEKIEKIMKNQNIYKELNYIKDDNKCNKYIEEWQYGSGSIFVKNMYYAAILFFYDKFGFEIENMEFINYLILKWAVNLIIINGSVNYKNINSYIVDGLNIFYKIENTRTPYELEDLDIINIDDKLIDTKYLVEFRKDLLKRVNNNE